MSVQRSGRSGLARYGEGGGEGGGGVLLGDFPEGRRRLGTLIQGASGVGVRGVLWVIGGGGDWVVTVDLD